MFQTTTSCLLMCVCVCVSVCRRVCLLFTATSVCVCVGTTTQTHVSRLSSLSFSNPINGLFAVVVCLRFGFWILDFVLVRRPHSQMMCDLEKCFYLLFLIVQYVLYDIHKGYCVINSATRANTGKKIDLKSTLSSSSRCKSSTSVAIDGGSYTMMKILSFTWPFEVGPRLTFHGLNSQQSLIAAGRQGWPRMRTLTGLILVQYSHNVSLYLLSVLKHLTNR